MGNGCKLLKERTMGPSLPDVYSAGVGPSLQQQMDYGPETWYREEGGG